ENELVEPQDFFPGETKLLYTDYNDAADRRNWSSPGPDRNVWPFPVDPDSEVMTLDLTTGAITNESRSLDFEEAEGMFPDARVDVMESDRDVRKGAFGPIDIYALALDGTGRNVRRLTFFADEPNRKAHQPSVSPDGNHVVFVRGVVGDYGPVPDP